MRCKRVSVWLLALIVAAWTAGCSSDGEGSRPIGSPDEGDTHVGDRDSANEDTHREDTKEEDATGEDISGEDTHLKDTSGVTTQDTVNLPDGQCTPDCGSTCAVDDGCGGVCACEVGFDCENGQCVEYQLTCIQIDKSNHKLYPPAGLRVVFRVTDCNGYPIRKLTQQDVEMINDAKGEPFGAGGEGGGASAPSTPSEYGLYSMLVLDMSDSIFNADAVDDVLNGAQLFVQRAVEQAPEGLKQNVGLMIFGRTAETRIVQDFTADHTVLYQQIDALRSGQSLGTTNLYGAYTMAIQAVLAEGTSLELTERSVVILTDGTHEAGDEENQRQIALAAKAAAESTSTDARGSLTVFSVGIRGNYDESKLRELATKPEYFKIAEDASALTAVFDEFATRTKAIADSNYAVGICTPVELGTESLTIRVQVGGAQTQKSISYNADSPGEDLTGDVSSCDQQIIADPCSGRVCGAGALPGSQCGTCASSTEICTTAGQCQDDCLGLQCGNSPNLSISCGTCSGTTYCSANQCVDDCVSRQCGTSPRGFDCGTCSGASEYCSANQCLDDCTSRQCGTSPRGFDCGTCFGINDYCNSSSQCVDDCLGRVCGTSIISGLSCGTCSESTACNTSGQCVNDCGTRVCGSSPLGVVCGACSGGTACNSSGQCVNDCGTRVCGSSPLGVVCGTCSGGTACNSSGQCVNDCGTRTCGTSPLGISCGICSGSTACNTSNQCSTAPMTGTRQVFSAAGSYRSIRPDTFMRGSPTDEPGRDSGENQHIVTLTRGFWLKETEVTQGEWQAVMGNNPSLFTSCGTNCPVERVSWWDAVAYCNALSTAQSLTSCYTLSGCSGTPGVAGYICSSVTQAASCTGYRLPTEAEWEYAYRAGTTTAFYNGPITQLNTDPNLELIGWYGANSGSQTKPVAGKTANAWGLHDMSGNVWEWTWDWHGDYASTPQSDPSGPSSGSARVVRGGAWNIIAQYCRAAQRNDYFPTLSDRRVGFRPARSF